MHLSLTLYPLHDCLWGTKLGCALVDQRRSPAQNAQWSAAGRALVWTNASHQRQSPRCAPLDWHWWQRLSSSAQAKIGLCASPALVHQRTEHFSGKISKRPHFTYGLYIYANLILGHQEEFLFMLHT